VVCITTTKKIIEEAGKRRGVKLIPTTSQFALCPNSSPLRPKISDLNSLSQYYLQGAHKHQSTSDGESAPTPA
jgi:hypothetical protein